jgi:hypothetical protein
MMIMNRTALVVTLALLFSMLITVLTFKTANANPWILFSSTEPVPGTVPPIITMSYPVNNTVYTSNTVSFSFNVTKPQPPTIMQSGINYVRYRLDGNVTGLYFCSHYSSMETPGIPEFSYSENVTVPNGSHTLIVEASGVVLPGNMTIFMLTSNFAVHFNVDATETAAPSPSPTPTPSPVATPTPTLTEEPQTAQFETILGVGITAVVIGAGLGLLLYLMKRKHWRPNSF